MTLILVVRVTLLEVWFYFNFDSSQKRMHASIGFVIEGSMDVGGICHKDPTSLLAI